MQLLTPRGVAHKAQITTHFLQRKESDLEKLQLEILRVNEELGGIPVDVPHNSGSATF